MDLLPFYYCYFSFRGDAGLVHELRVRVTPSLGLEWHLYRDHEEIASASEGSANVLMPAELLKALSYDNVLKMYGRLLSLSQK